MLKFEDKYEDIQRLLSRKKRGWENMLPHSMGWDDVCSIITTHIANKWALYDQNKNFSSWAATVIHNQLINICRNSYLSYAKPCFKCPHNMSCYGMEQNHETGKCAFTKSGLQCEECPDYAKWSKTKGVHFKVKYPVSLENFGEEIPTDGSESLNLEESVMYIKNRMKELLTPKQYSIFIMLHFENVGEEEVALKAGYKTNEAGRKPGYAQMAALKKKFKEMVMKIIQEMNQEI